MWKMSTKRNMRMRVPSVKRHLHLKLFGAGLIGVKVLKKLKPKEKSSTKFPPQA